MLNVIEFKNKKIAILGDENQRKEVSNSLVKVGAKNLDIVFVESEQEANKYAYKSSENPPHTIIVGKEEDFKKYLLGDANFEVMSYKNRNNTLVIVLYKRETIKEMIDKIAEDIALELKNNPFYTKTTAKNFYRNIFKKDKIFMKNKDYFLKKRQRR